MGNRGGSRKADQFYESLQGKKLPILTLDSKWYKLLDEIGRDDAKDLENELNELLKRQGKLNTDTHEIKKLKKKLMNEIVPLVDEMEHGGNRSLEKQIADRKRLIQECNEKLEAYQDELLELPFQIDDVNFRLMLLTMEHCYDNIQQNAEDIAKITEWVAKIRVELKKNLVRKQQMEQENQDIYAYMHDIFGADVVDLFDMQFLPQNAEESKKAKENEN